VFRISPPSWVEAQLFKKHLPELGMKKVDFLAINNDWGRGTVQDFSEVFNEAGVAVGLSEMMDQGAQDLSAQLSKIKASDSDTLIVTTAVEQLTLVLKQAAALGLGKKIITTGGSQNPDQLIDQAGSAANGTTHMVFFAPWVPEKAAYPDKARAFIDAWAKAGHSKAGLTESYRGYDGIYVIKAAIETAKASDPKAITEAFWKVKVPTLNGDVVFTRDGPAGQESGQYMTNGTLIRIEDGKIVIADP
jgi:branched-chain amino acid transport system substrate-binding protein